MRKSVKKLFAALRNIGNRKVIVSKEQQLLVLILILGLVILKLVNDSGYNQNLKDGITAEVFGGFFFAGLLALVFYSEQRRDAQKAAEVKASAAFHKILIPELEDILDDTSFWIIDRGKEFYISKSNADKVYTCYRNNIQIIIDYQSYSPENVLINKLDRLYELVRKVYKHGEVTDRAISNVVRQVHYSQNVNAANDGLMIRYVRAKLYLALVEDRDMEPEILRYMEWREVPARSQEIINSLEQSQEFQTGLTELKILNTKVTKLVESIKKEINTKTTK